MEENSVLYKLTLNFPISEETTKLYSENDEVMVTALQEAINRIEVVIRKDGFISLERIVRILGFRSSPTCPHILFDDLADYRFDGEWLDLELDCDFLVVPYEVKPRKLRVVAPEKNEEEEEWQESSPQETSGSGEKETT